MKPIKVEVEFAFKAPNVVASNGNAPPVSVPQTKTPPAFAFTSQEPAERLETARDVEVELVKTLFVAKRLVLVALVEVEIPIVSPPFTVEEALERKPESVVSALKVFVPVKTLVPYVFGIVVEASTK